MKRMIEILKKLDWANVIMIVLVIVWAVEVGICFNLRAEANKKLKEAKDTLSLAWEVYADVKDIRDESLKLMIGVIESKGAEHE